MSNPVQRPRYVESRIEDEPILGPVLFLPDGRIKPLSLLERWLVRLHLTNAEALAARHLRPSAR